MDYLYETDKKVNDEFIQEIVKLGYPNNTDGELFNENYCWFRVNHKVIYLYDRNVEGIHKPYKTQNEVLQEINEAINNN